MTVRLKYTLLAVVFLLGYTSMSFELLVLRQLINFVGSNTLITSVVITFILLFLSVGYYIGSVVHFSGCPLRLSVARRLFRGCLPAAVAVCLAFPDAPSAALWKALPPFWLSGI